MQVSGRNRALFLGCLICVILYTYLHFQYPSLSFQHLVSVEPQQQQQKPQEEPSQKPPQQEPQPPFEPLSKDDFVTTATRNAMAVYDSAPIAQFCAHDKWNSDIVVNCDRIFGGIGNLRQVILACLHHAMEEGRGFIIPPIELRNFDDLIQLEASGDTAFEYIFDRDLFVSRLSAACPRMAIYDSLQAAEEKGLEIYHFPTTMARYIICQDPPAFATNVGQLLVFLPTIYRLAYTALHALSITYSLPISPSPITSSPSITYLALHLRTSMDAVAMGWSSYESQSHRYLSLASSLPYMHIYIASGNATSVALFSASAAKLSPPRVVISKESLLAGPDLQEMQSLTWDQLALIDYVMLEHAAFFAGVAESSFSWNVAAKRRALAAGAVGFCERMEVPAELVWKDEWSLIYGMDDTTFGGKIWP